MLNILLVFLYIDSLNLFNLTHIGVKVIRKIILFNISCEMRRNINFWINKGICRNCCLIFRFIILKLHYKKHSIRDLLHC